MNLTPITDRLEASIEASGKRDVPVRVYQQMRALEDDRAYLLAALQRFVDPLEKTTHDAQRERAAQARDAITKATDKYK